MVALPSGYRYRIGRNDWRDGAAHASPASFRRCCELLQQPGWERCRGELISPLVWSRGKAGRGDYVAAFSPNVEPGPELRCAVADHFPVGVNEVAVPSAAARIHRGGGGEFAVFGFEALQARRSAIAGILIEDEQLATGSGGDADVRVGPASPPATDLIRVYRGVAVTSSALALWYGGHFGPRPEWKHRNTATGVVKGRVNHDVVTGVEAVRRVGDDGYRFGM